MSHEADQQTPTTDQIGQDDEYHAVTLTDCRK